MCGVNSQEEREIREFPRGPRLGQGKMSRALEVRKDEEKDRGEEGAHEKVSKIGLKEKRGGLWESVWRVHDVACGLGFALIHLSVKFELEHGLNMDLNTNTHNETHVYLHACTHSDTDVKNFKEGKKKLKNWKLLST